MIDKNMWNLLYESNAFDKIYEMVRIVDPVENTVIGYSASNLDILPYKCYDFWNRNERCYNCVSIRALKEQKMFLKIEFHKNHFYTVTAAPVYLNGKNLIVELVKDITNSLIYADGKYNQLDECSTIVDVMDKLVLKDALTNVYNRRFINDKLPDEIFKTASEEKYITLIMMDLDDFKNINDTYGHLVGDEVLKHYSKIVSQYVREKSDWISRYGGEEFLICIPGADSKRAKEIAQQMRKAIEVDEFQIGEHRIKITSSFGVCSVIPAMETSPEDLLQLVDKKLYEAKSKGKNRVEIYEG